MADAKTRPTPISPDDFVAALPDDRRRADAAAMLALFAAHTGEAAVMWGPSIIGFGTYRYRYASGRSGEACRVGFSPRKNEFALYLGVGRPEQSALLPRLGRYKAGKSCLYVKNLSDVDVVVLGAMIANAFAAEPEGWVRE